MKTATYETYVRHLRLLVSDASAGRWSRVIDDIRGALDDQPARQLRALIPRQTRREIGSFFTTGAVRQNFQSMLGNNAAAHPAFWDPTCGAGDLLLAASAELPLGLTPADTLTLWNRWLRGHDLHAPFTDAARMRLLLALLARHHARGDDLVIPERRWMKAFPKIQIGDGLQALRAAAMTRGFRGHLLLNPPYGTAPADRSCSWSSGQTSLAATFTAAAASAIVSGGKITAVLPDVLRSGSRYAAWREELTRRLEISEARVHGLFDVHTDVDVFLLSATGRNGGHRGTFYWWADAEANDEARVDDLFHVSIGPVVDNRAPHEGPEVPYLTARALPAGGEMQVPTRSRRFAGRLIDPPFVVLRRTSRPGQGAKGGSRGAGVLVLGDQPVAVDNHLIVAAPRSGGIDQCRELLDVLEGPKVVHWLDERIRCRHLTVTAVRGLPWR